MIKQVKIDFATAGRGWGLRNRMTQDRGKQGATRP